MSDSPTPDEVERVLRRMLASRADDMAPGDGTAWDPYRPRSPVVPLATAAEERRGPGWRTMAAAVAAVALPVAGGAFFLADNAERTNPPALPACAPPPPPTTTTTELAGPATTGTPTTSVPIETTTVLRVETVPPTATTTRPAALSQTGETTTTTTEPCTPPSTTTTTTTKLDAQACADPAVEGKDDRSIYTGAIDPETRVVRRLEVFVLEQDPTLDADAVAIRAGEYDGAYVRAVGDDRAATMLALHIGEVYLVHEGRGLSLDELTDMAATIVEPRPGRFELTPPADLELRCAVAAPEDPLNG